MNFLFSAFSRWFSLLLVVLGVWGAPALADVLPPARWLEYSRLFDSLDICFQKSESDACQIPGHPAEGGGPGRCVQEGGSARRKNCILIKPVKVRRDIPAYPYRAEPATCDQVSSGNFTLPQELTCRTPPVVADRFCAARRAGDDCTIEGVVGDAQPETVMYAGRCEQLTQQYPYVNDGLRTAKREILQCKPLTVGPPPKPAQ